MYINVLGVNLVEREQYGSPSCVCVVTTSVFFLHVSTT